MSSGPWPTGAAPAGRTRTPCARATRRRTRTRQHSVSPFVCPRGPLPRHCMYVMNTQRSTGGWPSAEPLAAASAALHTELGVNRFLGSFFSHATRRALRCSTHPPDSQCAMLRCTHDRCFVCPVYLRGICVLLCTPGCVGLMVCGPRACCLSRGPLPPPFVSRVFVLGVLFPNRYWQIRSKWSTLARFWCAPPRYLLRC